MLQGRLETVVGTILFAGTLALFGRACGNGFVNYDDSTYVTQNAHVLGGLTPHDVAWAFRWPPPRETANWHPLTWLSLQLDAQLFSARAWGYHLTSVVFHAANSLLLFHILLRITGALWRSAIVAALFAVHPLHVESVAWISERKDVLSTFLGLLTLGAYVRYTKRPHIGAYLWVVGLYALGLMAKSMLVTLPCVLLLLDYWPLRRFGWPLVPSPPPRGGAGQGEGGKDLQRALTDKLPLLALAVAGSVLTSFAQQAGGAVRSLERMPLAERTANALVAYVEYLGKALWPQNLAAYYPLARTSLPNWQPTTAALLLACITIIAIVNRRRRPYLIVGWLWYLGMLVPVIGLVQVGQQALADRYTYMPLVGIFLMVTWGTTDVFEHWRIPITVCGALCVAVLAALIATSWLQIGYWHDSVALWRHTIAMTRDNYFAENNLGMALDELGRQEQKKLTEEGKPFEANTAFRRRLHESIEHYSAAIAIKPDLGPAYFNRGVALAQLGKLDEGIADFSSAVERSPSLAAAYYNRGLAYKMQGRRDRAIESFDAAVKSQPSYAAARRELGLALIQHGDYAKARDQFAVLAEIDPDDASARSQLGLALCLLGETDQAIACFRKAIALEPASGRHYYDLAYTLHEAGQTAAAGVYYRQGQQLDPRYIEASSQQAWALATHPQPEKRNGPLAVRLASQVCQATHDGQPKFLDTLAAAYAEAGFFDKAVATAKKALQLGTSQADTALVKQMQARLQLYEHNLAYREKQ
jgi:tetratricopeptide (TPR) repeat protein